jgi:glycosyltransferase involved in cell wall biosynthesis
MKLIIPRGKAREVMFEGQFYQTGVELDVDYSIAMRMARELGATLPTKKNKYDPLLWKKKRQATFVSNADTTSGWGNVTTHLLGALPEAQFALMGRVGDVRDPSVLAASYRPIQANTGGIWHEQPRIEWMTTPFARNIAIVPFETTRIPPSWVSRINYFDALLVPCKQNVKMMRDSGVTVPISVIHWGVDPKLFYEIKRTNRTKLSSDRNHKDGAVYTHRPFTFGTMGMLSLRKGTDVLIDAFERAFPNGEDVRLICKTSGRYYPFMHPDKRIIPIVGPVTHQEMMDDFMSEIDCFVFPTRGEGFGLTPLEAMATGVPAIVTNWSGPVEYMNNDVGWTLDYTMDKATDFTDKVYKEDCGEWAIPSVDHLVQLMRDAYNNEELTKKKGNAAAEYVRKKWLWSQQVHLFEKALDKYLA